MLRNFYQCRLHCVAPGTNKADDTGPQLAVLAGVLEEAWDKLELFEERKRTNLIFCGVRGEARETQAELINKVGLLCKVRSLDVSYFHAGRSLASSGPP